MTPQHTVNDENRGHRAPLSPAEPTVYYGLKMPRSLKAWCIRKGPQHIRKILTKAAQKVDGYIITKEAAAQLKRELQRGYVDPAKPTSGIIKYTGEELLE